MLYIYTMLGQRRRRWTNIVLYKCYTNVLCLLGSHLVIHWSRLNFSKWWVELRANKSHWPNIGLLLVHRLWPRPNIKTTLSQRLSFAGGFVTSTWHSIKSDIATPTFFLVQPISQVMWTSLNQPPPPSPLVKAPCLIRGPVAVRNAEVLWSNPDRVGCLSSGLCLHSALSCAKSWSVQYCLWYRAL